MQEQNGKQVLEAIAQFEKNMNIKFVVSQDGTKFTYSNDDYKLELKVDPEKWISLDFLIPKARIVYPINTDLYNLDSPRNQTFIAEIQADIVHFIDALQNKKIMFTKKSGKMQVIVPIRNKKYLLLKQGLFFNSAKEIAKDNATVSEATTSWDPLAP